MNPRNEPTEPAVTTGVVTSLLAAVYVLINAIFPNLLSTEVYTAITSIVVILVPLITSIVIRGKVYAPATVSRLLDQQR